MITTILIDIDDTLLDFNLCAKWAMEESAKALKLDFPENAYDVFEKLNLSLWKQMERKEITTEGIYCVRWNMLSEKLNIPFDGAKFEDYFLDYLSKSIIEVDGAMEILEYLGGKYKLYAASNGPYEQQIERMKLSGMDQYLSGYFVSEKMGHSKPSKEYFDICYDETKVDSIDQLMMIGDSLTADIKGAIDYGIKTCWFNKNNKTTDLDIDYVVTDLLEIKRFL